MEFFMELSPPLRALIAGLFTWGFTALGASGVFLAKRPGQKTLDVMLGFAGGVMVAASFWSLLAPAIEISEELGYPGWLPPVAGFLAGGAALRLLDMAMPHLHPAMAETAPDGPPSSLRRTTLLVLAITAGSFRENTPNLFWVWLILKFIVAAIVITFLFHRTVDCIFRFCPVASGGQDGYRQCENAQYISFHENNYFNQCQK